MKLSASEIAAIGLADLPPSEVQSVFDELLKAFGENAAGKWLALTVTADLAQLRATGLRVDLQAEIARGHSERRRSEFIDARDRSAARAALFRNIMAVLRVHTELKKLARNEPCIWVPE